MQLERIPLRNGRDDIFLDAYWLENSAEFQADVKRPVVIVCPGGGYRFTSDREAEPLALRFLAQGFHACVLRYSVQTAFPAPMLDLAKAILMVRQRAGQRPIDADKISVCGFSAGGHLAAALGVMWQQPALYEPLGATPEQIKPNAVILGYPVIDLELVTHPPVQRDPQTGRALPDTAILSSAFGEPEPPAERVDPYRLDRLVTPDTPPTFLWHTADDPVVYVENALRFATALAREKVPFELHIYQSGPHGLALADEVTDIEGRQLHATARGWVELAVGWLRGL